MSKIEAGRLDSTAGPRGSQIPETRKSLLEICRCLPDDELGAVNADRPIFVGHFDDHSGGGKRGSNLCSGRAEA